MSARTRHWLTAVVAICAASAIGIGVAFGAIPDSGSGEISACYQKNNGQLRVIDAEAGDACRNSERPLVWSQTGPQGPQGPQGEPGPAGPAGAVELYTVTNTRLVGAPSGHPTGVTALCEPGDKVTGGGWSTSGEPSGIDYVIISAGPSPGGNGWGIAVINKENPFTIEVQARCVAAPAP